MQGGVAANLRICWNALQTDLRSVSDQSANQRPARDAGIPISAPGAYRAHVRKAATTSPRLQVLDPSVAAAA